MRWCPLTIRSSLDDKYTTSGVYIVDTRAKIEFCLSLSANLGEQVISNDNRAIVALDSSLDQVVWENLELVSSTYLKDVNQDLLKYSREFSVHPNKQVQLLVFKFIDSGRLSEHVKCALQTFNAIEPRPLQPATVTSSPFASGHMSMFHGYVTAGIVSLVQPNITFVDGRYLDGMEGGCVSIPDIGGSIGMVAGSLIKSNGEGKLLVVIPWKLLAPFIPAKIPRLWEISEKVNMEPVGGVVAVQMRRQPNFLSWGSGVLVSRNLVITNSHVVKNYSPETVQVTIASVTRSTKQIHHPVKALDLVLLELSEPFPPEYHPVKLSDDTKMRAGMPVHAVGYGLFAPGRYGEKLKPLQTDGIISKALKGMLMTTASCWNGSSGGALLNSENELLGIMTSNARDNTANEIMPDIAMSIPVAFVKLVLSKFVELSSATVSVDDQFQKLWRMDKTHEDISTPLKPKL